MRRRDYLKTAGGIAATGLLAGCGGDGGGNGNGGNGVDGNGGGGGAEVSATTSNTFEPETVTISTGEAVTWSFDSPGHNVECDPEQSDEAELPEGAEPFASYEGDNRFGLNDEGTTWEHTFETAGEYVYVCVPHAAQGMIGTVVVEE